MYMDPHCVYAHASSVCMHIASSVCMHIHPQCACTCNPSACMHMHPHCVHAHASPLRVCTWILNAHVSSVCMHMHPRLSVHAHASSLRVCTWILTACMHMHPHCVYAHASSLRVCTCIHLRNLESVLSRLRAANLKLQPSKCAMARKKVRFLGHVISSEGISTDPEKTSKVATWPAPTCKRDVQQFLGLANYYRRFIKNFAEIAKPLHQLTEKTHSFSWTDQCQVAFDELRCRLTSTPVLVLVIPTLYTTLSTMSAIVLRGK